MAQENPNFYAILPASVRYDEELPPMAKILYSEITALANKDGYCFASNKYFEELYKMSERNVSRLLKQLCARGYILIKDGDSKQRKIYIADVSTPTKMSDNIDKNVDVNPDKNVYRNNTSINNIKNTKKDTQKNYSEEFELWYSEYPNKWNKHQTYKNYLSARKNHSADKLLLARDEYIKHIRQSNITADYITRSTNFLGRKGEYIGWLERVESGQACSSASVSEASTAVIDDTADVIRQRREILNL